MNAYDKISYQKQFVNFFILFVLTFSIVFICGCSQINKNKSNEKDVIARVGKYTILKDDFLRRKQQMSGFFVSSEKWNNRYVIDLLIDDTLLLMEAEKLNINRNPQFLKSIEHFWRQSLVQELIKQKSKDIQKITTITDNEVKIFYEGLKTEYRLRIVEFKNIPDKKLTNSDKLKEYLEGNKAIIQDDSDWYWADIQELSYPVREKIMDEKFRLNQPVFIMDDGCYLFVVEDKRNKNIEAFEKMKNEIYSVLKQEKEQRALKSWLQNLRKKTDVHVFQERVQNA